MRVIPAWYLTKDEGIAARNPQNLAPDFSDLRHYPDLGTSALPRSLFPRPVPATIFLPLPRPLLADL